MHLSLKRWYHGAFLATTTLLAACGGGNEQTAAATTDLLDVAQAATIQAVSVAPEAGARLEGTVALAKISETRISRTVYEYAFSVTMRAGAAGARAAMARLLTVGPGTEIVNATVYIGDIAAGGTASSSQRITLRHDRTKPFRMEDLRFQLTGTAVEGRIVDGYIVGAQVYWDCNDNHQIDDATEPWTVSAAGGKYVIEPSPATACVLRAIVPAWAVDEATNATVTQAFRMSALAGNPNVINPFTTLVTDGGYTEAQLKTLFNLKGSVDADPFASGVQHDQALAGVIATGLKAAGGSAMTLAPDNRKLVLQDIFRLYPPDAFTDATLATSNNDSIARLLNGLPTWSFIQAETKLPEHRFVLRDPLKSGLCNALMDSDTCEKRKTFIRGALGLAEKYHAASGLNIDWSLIPPEERRALHAADIIPTNADVEAVRKELLAYSLAQQKAIEALRQSADSQMFKNMLAAQSDIAAKYADAVVAGYAVSNRAFDATVTTYRAATGPRQLNTLLTTLFVKKRKATALALLVNSPACLATLTSDVLKPLAEAPGDALEVTDAVLTFGLDGAACIASLVKGGDFKDWLTVASGSYKITINRAKLNMDDQQLADVLGYLSAVLDFAGAVVDLTPGTTPIAQKAMKWTALAVKSGNFVIGGLAAYLNQTVKDRKAYDQLIQAMDDGSKAQRIQFEAFGQMIFEARVNPYIVPDVFAGYIGEGGVTNVSIASLESRNADQATTAGIRRPASLVPGAAAAFTPAQHLQGHGGVQQYEWNFGDGSASVTTVEPSTVNHTYAWPGTYVVSLRTVSVGQTQFDGRAAERYEGVVTSNVTVQPNAGDQAWLADEFSGQAINGATWTVNGYPGAPRIGPVTIDANGIAQFAAWGAMDTRNKLVFSGSRIVIEARMAGTGPSRDTRIALVDVSDPNNTIQVGDTTYCDWGMYVHAFGAFRQSGPNAGCGANIPVPATGGSTSQFMDYRLTLDGDKIMVERGPSLATITQSLSGKLGAAIAGRSFYLQIGTASDAYSPGSFDWIRAQATGLQSPIASLEDAVSNTAAPSAPWAFGWQSVVGSAPTSYGRFTPAGNRTDYPTLAIWNKGDSQAPLDVYPWMVKNTGTEAVIYSTQVLPFPAQSIIVTPGSAGERAVFRWTAPTSGNYHLQARYMLMQGGTVDVRVQRNGTDIVAQRLAGAGSTFDFPATAVQLAAGDVIDFAVGDGGNGQHSDITRVTASVTPNTLATLRTTTSTSTTTARLR